MKQVWWFGVASLIFCVVVAGFVLFEPVLLFQPAAAEDCTNGVDDDGDGLIDANDGNCVSIDSLTPTTIFNNEETTLTLQVSGATSTAQAYLPFNPPQPLPTVYQGNNDVVPGPVATLFVTFPNICTYVSPSSCAAGPIPLVVSNTGLGGSFSPAATVDVTSPAPGTITVTPSTIPLSGGIVRISDANGNILPKTPGVFQGTVLLIDDDPAFGSPYPAVEQDPVNGLSYDYQTGELVFSISSLPAPVTVYLKIANPLSTSGSYVESPNSVQLSATGTPPVCQNAPVLTAITVSYTDPATGIIVTGTQIPNYLQATPITLTFSGTFSAQETYGIMLSGYPVAGLIPTYNSQTGSLELANVDLYGFNAGTYPIGLIDSAGCDSAEINVPVTGLTPTITTITPPTLTTDGGTFSVTGTNFYVPSNWATQSVVALVVATDASGNPIDWSPYVPGLWMVTSPTQIEITVPVGAAIGDYNFIVVNPGAAPGSSNLVSGTTTVTVTPVPSPTTGTTGTTGSSGGSSGGGGGGGGGGAAAVQCNDNRDNDGDGKIDFDGNGVSSRRDPGCTSLTDRSEQDPQLPGTTPLGGDTTGTTGTSGGTTGTFDGTGTDDVGGTTSSGRFRAIFWGTLVILLAGIVVIAILLVRTIRKRHMFSALSKQAYSPPKSTIPPASNATTSSMNTSKMGSASKDKKDTFTFR